MALQRETDVWVSKCKEWRTMILIATLVFSITEVRTMSLLAPFKVKFLVASHCNQTGQCLIKVDASNTVNEEHNPIVNSTKLSVAVDLSRTIEDRIITNRLSSVASVDSLPLIRGSQPAGTSTTVRQFLHTIAETSTTPKPFLHTIAKPTTTPEPLVHTIAETTTTERPFLHTIAENSTTETPLPDTTAELQLPEGYEELSTGLYKFHDSYETWDKARQICEDEHAHLIIVNSEHEYEVAVLLILSYRPRHRQVFAGFHSPGKDGNFQTVFGEPLSSTYVRWRSGEPNRQQGNEWCGSLKYDNGRVRLNDLDCSIPSNFICELTV